MGVLGICRTRVFGRARASSPGLDLLVVGEFGVEARFLALRSLRRSGFQVSAADHGLGSGASSERGGYL
jgi:hypothetical protein